MAFGRADGNRLVGANQGLARCRLAYIGDNPCLWRTWFCSRYFLDARFVRPYLRINAISAISEMPGGYSAGSGIMRALRQAMLVSQALQVTVRDVEMAATKDPSARYSDVQIASILSDALKAKAEPVQAFEQARLTVATLDALMDERFASGEQPDLSALKALMKLVGGVIDHTKASTQNASDDSVSIDPANEQASGSSAQTASAMSGDIRSREDVRRTLQRVCDYLERYEPSNPAALFTRRALGMLDRSFMDIMAELAPDALQHLQMITGAKPPEE